MTKPTTDKASALLEAHVSFMLNRLDADALSPWIESEIDEVLAAAAKLTLNTVVTREMIKKTAHAYAVELELHGALPELVGDIARKLYLHPVHDETTLVDLMPDRMFGDFLDKLLEMKELREKLLHESLSNPLFAALASDLLYRGIKDYLTRNSLTQGIPGASAAMRLGKSMISKATPRLEGSLESGLKKYIGKSINGTLHETERFLKDNFDDEQIRDVALGIWADIKTMKVSTFREYVGSRDVEDWFVTFYEYWHGLRKTNYYSALIDAGIDGFFDKYGKTSLAGLLAEIGITKDMLFRDAMRFAPHVLAALKKKKLLEPIIRRNLAVFYASPEVARILKS